MKFVRRFLVLAALASAAPLAAQTAPPTPASAPAQTPPKLVVVISVDQFSADLFAEYRGQFTGGLARLLSGAVFPAGYQSHAATETCPGHSTILTGSRPARTGIIANDWVDFRSVRGDKPNNVVYCAEDESKPGTTSSNYVVSDLHLKVPTLGEWMKGANPASRVVSVAGKDRAAVMMGGHQIDEVWYWWDKAKAFQSYPGRPTPSIVTRTNEAVTARIGEAQPAMELPNFCKARDRAYTAGTATVGAGRFERKAGDASAFRRSPEFDESILALGAGFALDMKLGQGDATDLLIIGASATDYVGHGTGTEGSEMCLQMFALDQSLGQFFNILDTTGVDYVVVLTADHGGHDITERSRDRGTADAERVDPALASEKIGEQIQAKLKLPFNPLRGETAGDVWFDPRLTKPQRAAVQAEALKLYAAHPQIYTVLTRDVIAATPSPKGPPETWTLPQRARASFDPERSGDLLVVLRPHILPIAKPGPGYTATHGSIWDYDRRVPILFWRKGMTGFEHPGSIETADIAPTLAGLLGIKVPVEIDGRCLDLDSGPGTTCR